MQRTILNFEECALWIVILNFELWILNFGFMQRMWDEFFKIKSKSSKFDVYATGPRTCTKQDHPET